MAPVSLCSLFAARTEPDEGADPGPVGHGLVLGELGGLGGDNRAVLVLVHPEHIHHLDHARSRCIGECPQDASVEFGVDESDHQ